MCAFTTISTTRFSSKLIHSMTNFKQHRTIKINRREAGSSLLVHEMLMDHYKIIINTKYCVTLSHITLRRCMKHGTILEKKSLMGEVQ